MGGKSGKQQNNLGYSGYWPLAGLFANHPGIGLAPFFAPNFFGGLGYGGLGCGGFGGYGGLGGYGGISPLAFPYGGLGGFPFLPLTGTGNLNLRDTITGATLKLKW